MTRRAVTSWSRPWPQGRAMLPALLLWAGAVVAVLGQEAGPGEVLPIRRVVLPADRVAAELEAARQGVLVKVPRTEFEARVAKALAALGAKGDVPRLAAAHYTAEVDGTQLVNGRGRWAVAHGGGSPAVLPIEPLGVALSACQWEDGGDVVLGELNGRGNGLLVDRAGRRDFLFDWTARGTPGVRGTSFELRLPACPSARLELKAPADCWLALPPHSGLLTGPFDAGVPGKKLWHVDVTGATKVELLVRTLEPDGPRAAGTLYQVQTTQQVDPDRVLSDFDFTVDVARGSVREIVFDALGELDPYEVTARGAAVEGWAWDPAAPAAPPAGASGRLTVRFREPQDSAIHGLRVRSRVPRSGAAWSSPALRPRHAVCRGEALRLSFHPDVQVSDWDRGDFVTVEGGAAGAGLSISLADPRAAQGGGRRPTAAVRAPVAEFNVFQKSRWHFDGQPTLSTDATYAVTRGQVFELAFQLPAGAAVDSVRLTPAGLPFTTSTEGSLLLVQLQRGLTPRADATVHVALRLPRPPGPPPYSVNVPDVIPAGAAVRSSQYAISAGPGFDVRLLSSSVSALAEPEAFEPRGEPVPAFGFAWRGGPLSARLVIHPRASWLRARLRQEVTLGSGTRSWRARVDLRRSEGVHEHLDVASSSPLGGPLRARVGTEGPVVRAERLAAHEALPHLLGLGDPGALGRAFAALSVTRGERWRLHFNPPLDSAATLFLEAPSEGRPPPAAPAVIPAFSPADPLYSLFGTLGTLGATPTAEARRTHVIPILMLPGRVDATGELLVEAPDHAISDVMRYGLTEASAGRAPAGSMTYTVQPGRLPALTVASEASPAASGSEVVCDRADVTTTVDRDGRVATRLGFRLLGWSRPRLAVTLPLATELLSARVNGLAPRGVDATRAGDALRVELPSAVDGTAMRVELVYRGEARRMFGPAVSVSVPDPRLPAEPRSVRRAWRVDEAWHVTGSGPLGAQSAAPGAAGPGLLRSLEEAWHSADEWLAAAGDPPAAASDTDRVFQAGVATMARQGGPARALGEAVDRLAFGVLSSRPDVIVDRLALARLGLRPDTSLPPGPGKVTSLPPGWEAAGLAHVSCPHAVILTTRDQAAAWRRRLGSERSLVEQLDAVAREAMANGSDGTGRFTTVACWLADGPADRDDLPAPGPDVTDEWLTAGPGADTVLLVDRAAARRTGWTLALVVAALAVVGFRVVPLPWGLRLHVTALAALTAARVGLADFAGELLLSPALVVELLTVLATLAALAWRPGQARRSGRSAVVAGTAAAALLLAGSLPPWGAAQPPDRYRVFLLPGSSEAPAYVLASPELLAELDVVAGRGRAAAEGAVLVSASYRGTVGDERASVDAQFEFFQFDDRATAVVPLGGVTLREGVFLDGAPAFPVAHRGGYAVPVRGKGFHRLSLSFDVRCADAGESRELRFNVPRLPRARVEFTWGARAADATLAAASGAVSVRHDDAGKGSSLRAELGPERLVHLRWRAATPPPSRPRPEFRELHLWDLRPGSPALSTWALVESATSLSSIRFAIPEGLRVRSVDAWAGPAGSASLVHGWEVTGKGSARRLDVELMQPASGKLHVALEFVPTLALVPGTWDLRLPVPVSGATVEGYVAYRVDAAEVKHSTQALAVAAAPEAFAKAWPRLARGAPPAVTQAFSFRRGGPAPALLLAIAPLLPQARVSSVWKVGEVGAELAGRVSVTAAQELSLVELDMPERCHVEDVSGPGVRSWSRRGGALQVWLHPPRRQAELEVAGWAPVSGGRTGEARLFELPSVSAREAQPAGTTVRLEPEPGLLVSPARLDRLSRSPPEAPLAFAAEGPGYGGTFRVTVAPPDPSLRAFHRVRYADGAVEWSAELRLASVPGDVRVHVSDWQGDDLQVWAPAGAKVERMPKAPDGIKFRIAFLPGTPRAVSLTLRGHTQGLAPGQSWQLPRVSADRALLRDAWVAVDGMEPAAPGVTTPHVGDVPAPPAGWPADEDDPTAPAIFRLPASRSAFALIVRRVPSAGPRVLAAEHQVRLGWAGRWEHALHLLVNAPAGGTLQVGLPGAPAAPVLRSGDTLMPVSLSGPSTLAATIRPGEGTRPLCLRWHYADDRGRHDKLRTAPPRLLGLTPDSMLTTVWLPPGLEAPALGDHFVRGHVERALDLAEAQITTSTHTATSRPSAAGADEADLVGPQSKFFALIRRAERLLASLEQVEPGEGTARLIARTKRLRQENGRLARAGGYDAARQRAERSPEPRTEPSATGGGPGLALSWRPLESTPSIQLRARTDPDRAADETVLHGMAVLCAALLLISFWPGGPRFLGLLVPEAVALAGLAGLLAWGAGAVGVALISSGAALRLGWLAHRLIAARSRPAGPETTTKSRQP